jgi:tRNA G18 (ribose-2'-O)-methylase SpoU
MNNMRGYFAIGIEGVSKAGNMGNLIRTAHGFGAAFVFTVAPKLTDKDAALLATSLTDTSKTPDHVPFYEYDNLDKMALPKGCQLVGVEITDEAVDMPSFRHPLKAVYLLGSEMFSVSKENLEKCDHVIKIPTKFSLNVATAGAVVMYDRLLCYGKFGERPVTPYGKAKPRPTPVRGMPKER